MQDSGGVSDREMPTDAEDDSSSRREPLSSVTPAELDHHPRGASQRKSWTAQEDAELTRIVHELGARRWEKVALQMPGRMGKRCRERWFKKAHKACAERQKQAGYRVINSLDRCTSGASPASAIQTLRDAGYLAASRVSNSDRSLFSLLYCCLSNTGHRQARTPSA